MKIHEKLQTVRCELQECPLKKTGNNTFSKVISFKLEDFLPTINKLCLKHKITPVISFTADLAIMTIYDFESTDGKDSGDPDTIILNSPMSTAALKGCHEVQNLGAVQTYLRRYLYLNAFEIVENDVIEGAKAFDAPTDEAIAEMLTYGFSLKKLADWKKISENKVTNELILKTIATLKARNEEAAKTAK